MGKEPDEIREEIEQTRDQMSQTADALLYKADVRSRAKEKITAKKDEVTSKAHALMPSSRDQAREQVTSTAKRAASGARDNAGLLAGSAATLAALIWLAKTVRARTTRTRPGEGHHDQHRRRARPPGRVVARSRSSCHGGRHHARRR